MVKSYDDFAKQKAREKLRDFIRRNLSFKKLSDIKVVCFPGAEEDGEEALEVKQVYDTIGIPRENIVGLECDPERADRLKKANLGIQVVIAFDYDFFKTTEQKFDIISLDYTGHQGKKEIMALEEIVSNQILAKHGILCTNYTGKRESRDLKLWMLHKLTRFISQEKPEENISREKRIEILEKEMSGNSEFSFSQIREAITNDTLEIFKCGKGILKLPEILTCYPEYQEIEEEISNLIRNGETVPDEKTRKVLIESKIFKKEQFDNTELLLDYKINMDNYVNNHIQNFKKHIQKQMETTDRLAEWIVSALICSEIKAYIPRKIERYYYNSNKNYLMLFDIIAFTQQERVYQKMKEMFLFDKNKQKLYWNPLHLCNAGILKKIRKTTEEFHFERKYEILPRSYLGSSWESPKKEKNAREIISKDNAIELLKSGFSTEEISDCYSGFTKGQLAAFKAHLTMGKYKV